MEQCTRDAAARLGVGLDEVKLIIPHQANARIIDAAVERLGLPRERFQVNLDRYGNTSGATIIIALDEAIREGKLQDGDLLILVAFGAGFTWATSAIRWVGNSRAGDAS
jgi:3-oxoacyl-[acyl-carrier-protein] synthase-3